MEFDLGRHPYGIEGVTATATTEFLANLPRNNRALATEDLRRKASKSHSNPSSLSSESELSSPSAHARFDLHEPQRDTFHNSVPKELFPNLFVLLQIYFPRYDNEKGEGRLGDGHDRLPVNVYVVVNGVGVAFLNVMLEIDVRFQMRR
ncbi:hypothetical protein OUZ56_012362 [Daphnia magna]|uniref:Uncharacterized protein n=1 Tax=Daphnia magna TaxID=35525 RepID=A0ABQ9Z2T2_9CRUS|nr:hypothetical protein OUZ56_012362 [Daphnia magna]